MSEPEAGRSGAHCFPSPTPERTRALGASLARAFALQATDAGLTIALSGDLGAGKTVFVKGLAEGLGVDPRSVSSPTFVLANQYATRTGIVLHHVDLYRLERADELETMGFFDLAGPRALVAVEWGDRFADDLPADHLELRITRPPGRSSQPDPPADAGPRVIEARATGPVARELLGAWRSRASTADH